MIICCGEALIDMIPDTDSSGHTHFTPHSGGAIYNTSIALGRLGIKTALLSGLSDDLFGKQLTHGLQASGVDTSFLITSQRPTTLAFVELKNGHATYTFYDENTAGRSILPTDLPDLPAEIDALYFGGISLCSEPGADTYRHLAQKYAEQRCIILDPNIRPGFIEDETRYRERLDAMIAISDIVKVSDEDLHWIIPGAENIEEKAQFLQAHGPSIVVMTRGASGVSAFHGDGDILNVSSQKVKVVDTVGAGDTFNAGMLASLSQQGLLNKAAVFSITPRQLESALKSGAAVAAVTVSRAGANPPWRNELPHDTFSE